MLLIEKVIKLLDEFHFSQFREHVKHYSVRSYYPLALVDVIDRRADVEQDSEGLYKKVYGDPPNGDRDMKKFFQLSHYTFKFTGFLARNYPDYLQHNITRIQQSINNGDLTAAKRLSEMVRDVAEKIEDFDTEIKILSILAQQEVLNESGKDALKYYERIDRLLKLKSGINELNNFVLVQLKDRGKEEFNFDLDQKLAYLEGFLESESFAKRMLAQLNTCHLLYILKDDRFYNPENLRKLEMIEDELEKSDYIIFPFLHNIRPRLAFLKLNYSIRQLNQEKVLQEAARIIEDSKDDLFWNSFVNLPEISSIAIQTSYFVTNYFTAYRPDHLQLIPSEIKDRMEELKLRCEAILNNPALQDRFVVRLINLTTIYSGLLLLGSKEEIKKSIQTLEYMLLSYQQVPFHAYIDPAFTTLIMGCFCLEDYEEMERNYRRYKKSIKGKTVNPENDLALHGFYYAAKWRETQRGQYANKLSSVLEQASDKSQLESTKKTLLEVARYFNIPIDTQAFT